MRMQCESQYDILCASYFSGIGNVKEIYNVNEICVSVRELWRVSNEDESRILKY